MQSTQSPSVTQLVDKLGLEPHVEGGYFKQTFKANADPVIHTAKGPRVTLTSIYYLLTAQSPIGHFHRNTSDIMHYFHGGDPITYYLIYPDGRLETKTLGSDVLSGHEFQFVVEGGVWKASTIETNQANGYGLIGEAVAPGFEYEDMQLAVREELINTFPQHKDIIKHLTRED
ncbi:cupin domain-containing protein [Aliiglaciecola lipolytica]|uniref:Cupin family protein n=1 Tax=Aliiglaciecola lipolytica E3 TaxID=1127673 RepID=K6YDL1_9ALTE|nr:cupin domain-containing protein [Aliiglaciecola lipolytica]GAC14733.1 cupin family protein [Aliiglaciecola lipolytica E3]